MSNRAFETLGKRRIGIILGGAMVLGAAVWIASIVDIPSSSPRMGFIHSRFTLPQGWSAGPITRTGASQFRAATDTRTVYGPDGFHIQLTYTPGVPNAGNFGWIPPGPPGTMEPGESRLNPWSSPYAAITWTPRAVGQGYVAETVATLGGTYRWQTSTFSRKDHSTLYRMILRWANTAHYPSVISPTQAVHAMMRQPRLSPTLVLAWHRSAGAMLTAGIPATGQAPWYLFTTENYGKRWHLAYVSRFVPARQRNGFPDTSPSDALVAMALTSARTIWIAQTINCMSGLESRGGTVTLVRTSNDGRSWQRIANHIQEPAGYCPTLLGLTVASQAKQPTVRLVERNATGTPATHSWSPKQWQF